MSDAELTETSTNDHVQYDYRLTLIRLMPAVTFGLQAAALAGLAVSAGAVAMGLAGVFDDSSVAVTYTTCSMQEKVSDGTM
ncbi:hypothetical protein [Actinophytocola oryzae]|uniref:Uncharacterized protein n=1 Tax=Actinophytocola oryzae TaxID=502181 RepID=A0A4R7VYQ9_9PSEU|nr:hypothetical protein [Actinophytocola oryzae]TDV54798.1 hypothetical protein CLV71_10338 [Actinophytocola oryzae]